MFRDPLTTDYLAEVARQGIDPDALRVHAERTVDLTNTVYQGRCLTRPAFLSASERVALEQDLSRLHGAMEALPERLFGGDLAAFARGMGLDDRQVAAVERSFDPELTRLARADIYHDGSAFRLMELNVGSSVGGMDCRLLNEALLRHPFVAEFVASHELSYVDGQGEGIATMRAECGLPPDRRLAVAAVDWPESFVEIDWLLHTSAAALAPYGIDAVACHLGQVRRRGGRVWVDDRPVDAIWRLFQLNDLRHPDGPRLIEPVLEAVARGEVTMFTPMATDLFSSKAVLAMVTDEAHRHWYDPATLASLDRLVPWTRIVRDEPVTFQGDRVELRELAASRREELVLKPTMLAGGKGVVLGWRVDADEWRRQVDQALDQPYVLQQRLRGEPEPFPTRNGLEPWLLRWGVFTFRSGFGGAMVIGSPDLSGGTLNVSGGATAGCCFHEPEGGPAPRPES